MHLRLANSVESFRSSVSWRQSQCPNSSGYATGFPRTNPWKSSSNDAQNVTRCPERGHQAPAQHGGEAGFRPRISRAELLYLIPGSDEPKPKSRMETASEPREPDHFRAPPSSCLEHPSRFRLRASFMFRPSGHRNSGFILLRGPASRGSWHRTGFVVACNSGPTSKH